MKGGHAARRHVLSMGRFDLASIPSMDANGHRLWLASSIWASGCFNRSATSANPAWMSPFEAFFGRKPPLKVVPFFQEGMMRVKRASKADVQSVRCFYLHGARNHSDTTVVLRADTGRICLSNNVVWINRRTAVPAPVPASGGGSSVTAAPSPAAAAPTAAAAPPPPWTSRTRCRTATAMDIADVHPHPAHSDYRYAAAGFAAASFSVDLHRVRSSVADLHGIVECTAVHRSHAAPSTARKRRRSRSPSPAAFTASRQRVGRERNQGGGTALQHRLGLLSMMGKDALVSSLATREAVDQGRRDLPPSANIAPPAPPQPQDTSLAGHGSGGAAGARGPGGLHMFAAMFATREDVEATLRAKRPPDKTPDLPHCLASDLRVPKTFKEAMRSQHSELWDDAVGREFFGLLDAGTFSPV
ncbi:unnamed protein product [Ectocarpus sp. CCAP 1310/34]|nr:unnamed protein product [Ectocarpus sp. CCAP 1310/34]